MSCFPHHFAALLATATLCFPVAHAAEQVNSISCPLEIQPQAIKVTTSTGWIPHVEFPLKLYTAGMSSGPPGSLLILRGEETRRTKQLISIRYHFYPAARPNGVWLDCSYGEGGEISMSRQLNVRIKECTVTKYKPVLNEPRRVEITCDEQFN